jgi:hypothetical protein
MGKIGWTLTDTICLTLTVVAFVGFLIMIDRC